LQNTIRYCQSPAAQHTHTHTHRHTHTHSNPYTFKPITDPSSAHSLTHTHKLILSCRKSTGNTSRTWWASVLQVSLSHTHTYTHTHTHTHTHTFRLNGIHMFGASLTHAVCVSAETPTPVCVTQGTSNSFLVFHQISAARMTQISA